MSLLLCSYQDADTHFYVVSIELNRLGGIRNSVAIGFKLDVCLQIKVFSA